MATYNIIFLEILLQEFDTIFDFTPPEGPELNLLNINIILVSYGIRIYQTDHKDNASPTVSLMGQTSKKRIIGLLKQ